jgi:hypothetical protein
MARPTLPTFADRYQIRTFGNDYQIQYDTVLDHDTYNWLRVSFEVDRGNNDKAVLVLNGKEIGIIMTIRDESGRFMGFHAYRKNEDPSAAPLGSSLFNELGHAAAAIITNYVN